MFNQPYVILIILILTMGLFIWGKWRFDVVAMIALMTATALGVVPFSQVYTGLGNPAVITVACVMIISNSISRTGLLDSFVQKLTRVTQNTVLHIALLTTVAAILSAFMNNVGALALMMPISIQTFQKNKESPSKILMPLAFASALGGLTTIIGTPPNLLVSSYRQEYTGHAFAMFDYAYLGIPLALICLVFIIIVGWRLLPTHRKVSKRAEDLYQIHEYITEIKIPEKSPAVDITVAKLESMTEGEFLILGLIRNKKKKLIIQRNQKLKADDILIIEASTEDLQELVNTAKLQLVGDKKFDADTLKSDDVSLIEAVVPQGSQLDGRSTFELRLRSRFHINLLAIARQDKPFRQRIKKTRLKAGDVLLLQGITETLRENAIQLGLMPLVERDILVSRSKRAYLPLLIFFIAIVVAAFQIAPVPIAFSGAVIFMVLTKTLPARMIYSSIEWPIIILLAAMIPLGTALQTSGGTRLISHYFILLSAHASPLVILGTLLFATMTLSDFMNNAATTVVMAPIAVSIAQALKLNIDPFLMAVAIGASCSFLTPVGHQNNTLVMGPGGYRFTDYIRLGLPVEILILLITLPLITWAWPLK